MRIQNNITVFTGDTQNNAQTGRTEQTNTSAGDGKNKTIYAGNLLTEFPMRDRIAQRKAQAQERAMKVVNDAWSGDRKIDEEIERSKERLKDLKSDIREEQDIVNWLTEKRDSLMQAYGVEADSKEQQDLELLAKREASGHVSSGVELSAEEREQLAEIDGNERTKYQERWMELNEQIWTRQDSIWGKNREIEVENAVVRGIREERRKMHKMADAQEDAEDIMEASRDEIIGMVMEEAKDHIDEEQEKKEEEAEAIQEKKEEQEEILEKRKENGDDLEELMKDMPMEEAANLENTQAEIRKEIQDIVNKMNLVAEDIKGAMVDKTM